MYLKICPVFTSLFTLGLAFLPRPAHATDKAELTANTNVVFGELGPVAVDRQLASMIQRADAAVAVTAIGLTAPSGASIYADFPCTDCFFQVPKDYDESQPTPLWMALHGDEGTADYTYSAHKDAMDGAGYLLVALQCPVELGCKKETGTWYEWEQSSGHDPAWVGNMRDAIAKDYNVDPNRIYLSGFSAGAMYLSFYALDFSTQYAGVIYETCGSYGHDSTCTAECKIPAYFLEGSEDFCLFMAEEQRDYFEACGHEYVWDVVEGKEHSIITERFPEVLKWTQENPLNCGDDSTDTTSTSTTTSTDSEDSTDSDTIVSDDSSATDDNGSSDGEASDEDSSATTQDGSDTSDDVSAVDGSASGSVQSSGDATDDGNSQQQDGASETSGGCKLAKPSPGGWVAGIGLSLMLCRWRRRSHRRGV